MIPAITMLSLEESVQSDKTQVHQYTPILKTNERSDKRASPAYEYAQDIVYLYNSKTGSIAMRGAFAYTGIKAAGQLTRAYIECSSSWSTRPINCVNALRDAGNKVVIFIITGYAAYHSGASVEREGLILKLSEALVEACSRGAGYIKMLICTIYQTVTTLKEMIVGHHT